MPIEVTAFGILIFFIFVKPLKAESPIDLSEAGRVNEDNLLMPEHRFAGMCSTSEPKVNDST